MRFFSIIWLVTGAFIWLQLGCTNEPSTPLPCEAPVTYLGEVKAIVDVSCALPDCHSQGFSLGDFTSFAGLKAKATDSSLFLMVVDKKLMPPAASAINFSEEQRSVFECWLKQGAQEH